MSGKIDKLLIDSFFATQKMALNLNVNIFPTKSVDQKLHRARGCLGSTGCQPVVCGSLPQTSFEFMPGRENSVRQAAGRDRLAACAPQSKERDQPAGEFR